MPRSMLVVVFACASSFAAQPASVIREGNGAAVLPREARSDSWARELEPLPAEVQQAAPKKLAVKLTIDRSQTPGAVVAERALGIDVDVRRDGDDFSLSGYLKAHGRRLAPPGARSGVALKGGGIDIEARPSGALGYLLFGSYKKEDGSDGSLLLHLDGQGLPVRDLAIRAKGIDLLARRSAAGYAVAGTVDQNLYGKRELAIIGGVLAALTDDPNPLKIERKPQARKVVAALRKLYPDAHCELDFRSPLELIAATILSAQCTDKRVNVVTKTLFARYKTAKDYAEADPAELESIVKSTGFFRAKAKSIREMAAAVVSNFGGKVPEKMEDLLTLRGVARKTANVVLGTAFGKAEGVVVDTHMKRVSYRLGLTDEEDPVKVEKDLMACVPRQEWIFFGHAMVWHGRRACKAAAPACPDCPLNKFCPKRGV